MTPQPDSAQPRAELVDVVVLGPVGLLVDGAFAAPGSQVLRALLGVLAVAPRRELSTDAVSARVWGDGATSRGAVSVAIHRLRRWLADTVGDAVRVERMATGYRLVLERGDTDTNRFHALETEDAERALRLWRGRPFADLPDGVADPAVVADLEQRRRLAWISLGNSLLDTQPQRAALLLRPVTHEHALDEELHRVLIEALARSGNQVEALNTYEGLRARLADELGVDPGAELQHTYLRILHQELHSTTTSSTVAAQLPSDPVDFTGRDDALRRLDKMLAAARTNQVPMVAALVGMAGVGKTALAVHWAHQVAAEFPDGQLYLTMRGYSPGVRPLPAQAALTPLLRSLGMPTREIPTEQDAATAEFRSRTAGKRLLIVLDNARAAEQVRPLLTGAPGCCTLITSRDQLGGLVAVDGAQRVRLDALAPADAATLLAGILGDRVHREPGASAELAALCGRLPLALRIAAANLDARPGVTIDSHVSALRQGDLLGALAIAGDPDAGVRAAFDLSFDALSAQGQRLFRLLGSVGGPDIALDAVAALSAEPVYAPLEELITAHLIERSGTDRFTFHDLLRHYARERASEQETAPALHRLATWYLANTEAAVQLADPHWVRLSTHTGHTFISQDAALDWLDAERANIVAIVEQVGGAIGRRMANAVAGYLHLRGHVLDAYTVAEAAVTEGNGTVCERAAAYLDLARADQRLSHYQDALGNGARALELSEQAAWPAGQSSALAVRGVVFGQLGEYAAGFDHATKALRISTGHGLAALEAWQRGDIGIANLWIGQLDAAEENFLLAREIHRSTGSVAGENISIISLAQLCLEAGRLDEAVGYLAAASELVRRAGEILGWPRIFNTLAAVHCAAGRYSAAVTACRTALPVAERTADRVVRSSLLNNLGEAYLGLGRYDECLATHQEALELAGETGLLRHQGAALIGIARHHRITGNPHAAAELAERALRLERASCRVWRAGQALTELAACEQEIGAFEQAEAHIQEALGIHEHAGHQLAKTQAEAIASPAARS